MAQPNQSAEPSMEEILASIRRIISDEHSEQAEEVAAAPQAAPAPAEPEPELTPPAAIAPEPVAEAPMVAAAPEPEPTAQFDPLEAIDSASDDLDLPPPGPLQMDAEDPFVLPEAVEPIEDMVTAEVEADEPFMLDAPMDEPQPEPTAPEPSMDLATMPTGLLEPETDAAVASGFRQLEEALASQGRSIDALTDEVLRPLVKTWLDDNLPQLVERLVREEIQRVARGG